MGASRHDTVLLVANLEMLLHGRSWSRFGRWLGGKLRGCPVATAACACFSKSAPRPVPLQGDPAPILCTFAFTPRSSTRFSGGFCSGLCVTTHQGAPQHFTTDFAPAPKTFGERVCTELLRTRTISLFSESPEPSTQVVLNIALGNCPNSRTRRRQLVKEVQQGERGRLTPATSS